MERRNAHAVSLAEMRLALMAALLLLFFCPKVYSTKGLKAKNMLKAKVEWLEVRLGLRVTKRLLIIITAICIAQNRTTLYSIVQQTVHVTLISKFHRPAQWLLISDLQTGK